MDTTLAPPMSMERVQAASAAMKVFPLPSAVHFPGAMMPLHIFEPRYRELVRDALATDKVMAMAQFEPGWEGEYVGRPPMRPICCAGLIVWHEALKDGRFNIILQGFCRARILDEPPARKSYREVRVQLLPDAELSRSDLDQPLRQAVLEIAGRVSGDGGEALLQAASHAKGGALADIVASALIPDVERRQQLLAELDVAARMKAVLSELGDLIARMGPDTPPGSLN